MWGKFRTNRSPERSVGVGTVEAVRIQVEGSEGEGPRKIDLANPAPFGYSIAFTLGLVALIDRAESAVCYLRCRSTSASATLRPGSCFRPRRLPRYSSSFRQAGWPTPAVARWSSRSSSSPGAC